MTDAERFVQEFVATWGDPTRFPDIYEPGAIIESPAVRRRIVAGELAAFIERTKALLPDARQHVERWAARDDFVLIEWRIVATLAGEPIEWAGMSRFTLRGSRAVEEIVHFDTLPLWERLDPSMRRPGLLETAHGVTSAVASENVVVLNRYYDEVWNGGDLSVLDEVVSHELVAHDPAIGDFGFEQLKELARTFRVGFPDFRVTTEDVVAQGDGIALRFRSEGTFAGPFMGAAPTGVRVSYVGLVMYRFARCRIVEIWMGWDPASLLRQVGAQLGAPPRPPG